MGPMLKAMPTRRSSIASMTTEAPSNQEQVKEAERRYPHLGSTHAERLTTRGGRVSVILRHARGQGARR